MAEEDLTRQHQIIALLIGFLAGFFTAILVCTVIYLIFNVG
jgi:hypothetical protein